MSATKLEGLKKEKPAVVSQGTQPSQNPGSKEDDKKRPIKHTQENNKGKKDKENSNEDEGEFKFDDNIACIEYIKTSYHAKADRESTWELPHNTGRKTSQTV